MSWFSQGYEKVNQRVQEIEEAMNRPRVFDFIIKEDEEDVVVRFLTAEPITYYEHFLQNIKRSFTCPDGGDLTKGTCPLCAAGNRANFKGAYLVADHRHEEWTDNQGKKQTRHNALKIAKFGVRGLKAIEKQHEKLRKKGYINGIIDVDMEVTRSGKNQDTNYNFVPVERNQNIPTPELPEGFTDPYELVREVIKPRSREDMLRALQGRTGTNGNGGQTGNGYGKPLALDDDDEIINFN